MDFGRALFGPVGGAVFACMVAVSCFGALNGTYTRFHVVVAVLYVFRLHFYICAINMRGESGAVFACNVWTITQDAKDAAKRHAFASRDDFNLHRSWWRFQIAHQLLR